MPHISGGGGLQPPNGLTFPWLRHCTVYKEIRVYTLIIVKVVIHLYNNCLTTIPIFIDIIDSKEDYRSNRGENSRFRLKLKGRRLIDGTPT